MLSKVKTGFPDAPSRHKLSALGIQHTIDSFSPLNLPLVKFNYLPTSTSSINVVPTQAQIPDDALGRINKELRDSYDAFKWSAMTPTHSSGQEQAWGMAFERYSKSVGQQVVTYLSYLYPDNTFYCDSAEYRVGKGYIRWFVVEHRDKRGVISPKFHFAMAFNPDLMTGYSFPVYTMLPYVFYIDGDLKDRGIPTIHIHRPMTDYELFAASNFGNSNDMGILFKTITNYTNRVKMYGAELK